MNHPDAWPTHITLLLSTSPGIVSPLRMLPTWETSSKRRSSPPQSPRSTGSQPGNDVRHPLLPSAQSGDGRTPKALPLPPFPTPVVSPQTRGRTSFMTTFSLIEQRRIEAARLQAQQAQILRDLAHDPTLDQAASVATAPGDTRKLRGIPAIGRGVAGAIPDTQPERAVCR